MLVNLDYVLKKAQKEHYGVGLFNTTDTDMLEAAISAAEELNSPIIIGTAEVLLPHGELDLIAPSIIAAAKRARQLTEENKPLCEVDVDKPVSIAVKELYESKIKIVALTDAEEVVEEVVTEPVVKKPFKLDLSKIDFADEDEDFTTETEAPTVVEESFEVVEEETKVEDEAPKSISFKNFFKKK